MLRGLSSEGFQSSFHEGMAAVPGLDPMLLTTAALRSIAMLGYQTLQAKFASFAEQVRSDLTLLEIA